MKTSQNNALSLEEQAAIAVRLGRELNEMAAAICAGGNSRDFGFVRRTLQRLGEREPFDPRDDASLDALAGIFDTDLKSETLGHDRVFVETHFDADGQHGEVRDVPNYSDRGRKLQQVIETLTRFMAARNATIDRIAAERAVLRLLRM
jgi:hypothetical protein